MTGAFAHRDLGVLGGLPPNRRCDYAGGCQAVQEDTSSGSAGSALHDRGQGGPRPTSNRFLFVPTAQLPASSGRPCGG